MMHQVQNYHSRLDYQKSQRRLYSFRRYQRRSLYLRHYSISSSRSSKSSYFIVLSALNYSQHMPFSGCSQKLMGLLSIQTTLLISLPNKFKSFTYQSISLYSSTMRSQCYCVRICLIFLEGSMRLITSSTQLLTPAEKMTGQHSSARQERKLSRFLRLQMLSRHSYSSNHRWKSSFRLGAMRYPSSSGVKVKASTSSISSTTVNFDGFEGGGSNLGFNLLPSRIASAKYRLFLGLSMGCLASAAGFLLKLKKLLDS